MENFPTALVIASYESVCQNNNTLYRLVRPIPDDIGVQSTDRLVNVVPFRRKYTFEKKQELFDFAQQILRRPLVLQPVLHFGRGLGQNCALCYEDELWLVMVNQTHPKILSRLQMGLDSAKGALERGQPFEIRFRFGKLIQRVYREHLKQKERGEAEKSNSSCQEYLTYFRYAEWDHCDLNLRYHGYGANINRSSALHSLPNLEVKWDFEDIGMHEMEWSQFSGQVFSQPHLAPVSEDEIRGSLPGWTINSVSPLQNIGDSIPENNYNYAQAGRLYSSFRKKKLPRQRPQAEPRHYDNEQHVEDNVSEDLQGAVGYNTSVYANFHDDEPDAFKSHYTNHESAMYKSSHESRHQYDEVDHGIIQHESSYIHLQDTEVHSKSSGKAGKYVSGNNTTSDSARATQKPDKYGHINATVTVISPQSTQHQKHYANLPGRSTSAYNDDSPVRMTSNNDKLNSLTSEYHLYEDTFKKQDSDRFSRSTNADSGIGAEENHSSGDSYDNNDPSSLSKLKQNWRSHGPYSNSIDDYDDGIENPAFRNDFTNMNKLGSDVRPFQSDERTKQAVGVYNDNANYHNQHHPRQQTLAKSGIDVRHAPPRLKKQAPVPQAVVQVAESFI